MISVINIKSVQVSEWNDCWVAETPSRLAWSWWNETLSDQVARDIASVTPGHKYRDVSFFLCFFFFSICDWLLRPTREREAVLTLYQAPRLVFPCHATEQYMLRLNYLVFLNRKEMAYMDRRSISAYILIHFGFYYQRFPDKPSTPGRTNPVIPLWGQIDKQICNLDCDARYMWSPNHVWNGLVSPYHFLKA